MEQEGAGNLQFIQYYLHYLHHCISIPNLNEELFGRGIIRVIPLKIPNQRAKLGDLVEHCVDMFGKDILRPGSLPNGSCRSMQCSDETGEIKTNAM